MLFKVYAKDDTVLGYIDRYVDSKFVDHFPNDTDTLEITFYKPDIDSLPGPGSFCTECMIEVKDETTANNRWPAPDSIGLKYVIKEVTYHDNKTLTVFCKLDLGTLESEKFVAFNPDAETLDLSSFASYILNEHASGWSPEFSIGSPPDTTISAVLQMELCSPIDVIRAGVSVYGYEYYIDQKNGKVIFGSDLSSDTLVMSTLDLNLSKLESTEDSIEYYNEVEAYGKDGLTVGSWGSVDSEGRRYYSNYGYMTKPRRLVIRDDQYTTQASLRQFVLNKLAEVSVPKRSYKVDLIDLGRIIGNSNIPPLNVGDIVRVEKPEGDLISPFVNLRITQMTRYPDHPDRNTCILSTAIKITEDYLKQSANTASTVSRISSTVQKISDDTLDFKPKSVSVTMSGSSVISEGSLSIKKWGKIAIITGYVIMDHTGNDQVVASFDRSAAPPSYVYVSCDSSGTEGQSLCYVTANGTVGINAHSTKALRINGVWVIN